MYQHNEKSNQVLAPTSGSSTHSGHSQTSNTILSYTCLLDSCDVLLDRGPNMLIEGIHRSQNSVVALVVRNCQRNSNKVVFKNHDWMPVLKRHLYIILNSTSSLNPKGFHDLMIYTCSLLSPRLHRKHM